MALDLITSLNFVLAVAIAAVGFWGYSKNKSRLHLYMGAAFTLFAISHMVTLLGLADSVTTVLAAIRIVGYVTVLYALYIAMKK